jgi:DNA-binding transcriptional MerR regulator
MPRHTHDDITSHQDGELVAIPRLAEEVGVTPRVMRYWEEQGLISPSREHGKLRYSPHDLALARLVKILLDAGMGIDGVRALRTVSEREIRSASNDPAHLSELAARLLYARKAFREVTGAAPEHFPGPEPEPPHPPPHGGPSPPPRRR